MALQHLRSSTADKRPTPTSMADGQVAINTAAVSPGVFFKDAGGSLVKVGPVHVGTTAPNVSPAVGGHAGNSVGEQWLDTTGGTYVFKVWDGSAWRSETGTFVDVNGDVMTGALGIIAGTAGAPGLYISGDTNTGIYSPGADQVAISTNGVARLTTSTTAVSSSLAIDVPLGAVGTPSITFTGDLNTGIYSPAADTIAFVEGGAEAMRIDSSGRLGLGTSSPSTVFHTRGGFPTATIQRDTGTGAASSLGLTNTTNSGFLITGSDTVFTITASSDVTAGTGLSERLRIDSTGRVGIGTTSPDRLLHVSAADTAYIRLENQDSTGSVDQYVGLIEFEGQDSGGSGVRAQIGGIYEGVSGATALVFGTSADAGSVTERLRINRNGNVGIGTTSPSAPLEVTSAAVNGVASEGIRIHMPGSFGGGLSGNSLLFTAQDSGSSNVIYSSIASLISSNTAGSHAGILTFNTVLGGTNTERARITSAGRLGIGTASPGATLHVAGECVLGDNGTNGRLTVNTTTSTVGLFATTTGFGAYEDLELRGAATIFKRDGTNESARIDSSGRLLVGTSTARANFFNTASGQETNLQLEGTGYAGSSASLVRNSNNSSGPYLILGKTRGTTTGSNSILSSGDDLGVVSFQGADGSELVEAASILAELDASPAANSMPGRLVFSTTADGAATPTERLRITSTGRVGIGTTAPGYLLHLLASNPSVGVQDSGANGTRALIEATNSAVYYGSSYSGSNVPTIFSQAGGSGGIERMRIDSSGRLLVGTSTSPSNGSGQFSAIVAQGYIGAATGDGSISIQRGEAAASITSGEVIGGIYFNESTGYTFANIKAEADANAGAGDYPGRLVFSTTADGSASPTERMRITSSGLFQLGTTNVPSGIHEFNWQGSNRMAFNNKDATSANCYGIVISYTNATPNSAGSEFIYCQDATAVRATIRANGGLVNYQANNVNLSDRNAKKDISPASGTWACLKEWEIVNYRYKDQPDDADLNLGVIAQQVAKSCPEVITVFQDAKEATDDVPAQEERLGVKEQQMMWMAIKALQEAQLRIEELEAKVAALEAA